MPLTQQILHGNTSAIQHLIQEGADVNEIDVYGYTPLIEAAIVNNVEAAKILLENGAVIDKDDMAGRTPLHWATDNNALALADLFLQYKAAPNATARSALSCASVMASSNSTVGAPAAIWPS